MSDSWTPALSVSEIGSSCRLSLDGVAWAEGATLQEAADNLVAQLVTLAQALRDRGWTFSPTFGLPDRRQLVFLWELAAVAARGDDIRAYVFGGTGDRL